MEPEAGPRCCWPDRTADSRRLWNLQPPGRAWSDIPGKVWILEAGQAPKGPAVCRGRTKNPQNQ